MATQGNCTGVFEGESDTTSSTRTVYNEDLSTGVVTTTTHIAQATVSKDGNSVIGTDVGGYSGSGYINLGNVNIPVGSAVGIPFP